jgi:hypothetical protein
LLTDERQGRLGTATAGSIKQVANEVDDRSICAIMVLVARNEGAESFKMRRRVTTRFFMDVRTYPGAVPWRNIQTAWEWGFDAIRMGHKCGAYRMILSTTVVDLTLNREMLDIWHPHQLKASAPRLSDQVCTLS